MKVKLTATTLNEYSHDSDKLTKLGFDLKGRDEAVDNGDYETYEALEFVEKNINSLDEFKDLLKDCGQSVIRLEDDFLYMEIYNDYRE
jgi:hypothetical protein